MVSNAEHDEDDIDRIIDECVEVRFPIQTAMKRYAEHYARQEFERGAVAALGAIKSQPSVVGRPLVLSCLDCSRNEDDVRKVAAMLGVIEEKDGE